MSPEGQPSWHETLALNEQNRGLPHKTKNKKNQVFLFEQLQNKRKTETSSLAAALVKNSNWSNANHMRKGCTNRLHQPVEKSLFRLCMQNLAMEQLEETYAWYYSGVQVTGRSKPGEIREPFFPRQGTELPDRKGKAKKRCEHPRWDSNPQPLNAFGMRTPDLEVQCANPLRHGGCPM